MTDLRQAAMQALVALEQLDGIDTETECVTIDVGDAITALRKALEQLEQEPVADGNKVICPACCHQFRAIPTAVQTLMLNAGFEPPFVTPPAAQRKPLTHEQAKELVAKYGNDPFILVYQTERAHNIKEGT